MSTDFQFYKIRILEIDGGDGHTLCMYLIPLNLYTYKCFLI